MLATWKKRVRQLKTEVYAIYLAYHDPRTPWYTRLTAIVVVGYAFSPLDLIPDFVPVLGYLDDLILVPLGILLARKLIPPAVLAECRLKALERSDQKRPTNWTAAIVVVAVWILTAVLLLVVIQRMGWF